MKPTMPFFRCAIPLYAIRYDTIGYSRLIYLIILL